MATVDLNNSKVFRNKQTKGSKDDQQNRLPIP
jgi:hypothetical protein